MLGWNECSYFVNGDIIQGDANEKTTRLYNCRSMFLHVFKIVFHIYLNLY